MRFDPTPPKTPLIALALLLAACTRGEPECPDPAPEPAVESAPAPPVQAPREPEPPRKCDVDQDPGLVIPVPGGAPICFADALEGTRKDGLAGLRSAVDLVRHHGWSSYEDPPLVRRDALLLLVDHLEHMTDGIPHSVLQVHLTVMEDGPDAAPEPWGKEHRRWIALGYRIGYALGDGYEYEPDLTHLPDALGPMLTAPERAWAEAIAAESLADDGFRDDRFAGEGALAWFGDRAPLFGAVLAAESLAALGEPTWADESDRMLCQTRRQLFSTCEYQLEGKPDCNLSADARAELQRFVEDNPALGTTPLVERFLESAAKTGDHLTATERQALIDTLVGPCEDKKFTWEWEC